MNGSECCESALRKCQALRQAYPDTSDVTTVEDFYLRRHLYRGGRPRQYSRGSCYNASGMEIPG